MIILYNRNFELKNEDAELNASSGQERNIIVQFYSEHFCSSGLYKKLIKGDWVIKLDIITQMFNILVLLGPMSDIVILFFKPKNRILQNNQNTKLDQTTTYK